MEKPARWHVHSRRSSSVSGAGPAICSVDYRLFLRCDNTYCGHANGDIRHKSRCCQGHASSGGLCPLVGWRKSQRGRSRALVGALGAQVGFPVRCLP